MSLINELLQLTEKKIKAFGPKFGPTDIHFPQFSDERDAAECLSGYAELGDVYPVEITINKAAKAEDVEVAVEELGLTKELGDFTPAEILAGNPNVRKALEKKGFDGFADLSILENTEPMQYVVFKKSQVKYKLKETVTEAKETMEKWAKPMVALIKGIDKKVEFGISGMGSSDGHYVDKAVADKIKAAFKADGYKIERHGSNIAIVSKTDPTVGVTISTPDSSEREFRGQRILNFFTD